MISKLPFLKNADTFERILAIVTGIAAAGILIAAGIYLLFGESLIESIYHGRSFEPLNNLIKYQHKYSLEHYILLGNDILKNLLLVAFAFIYMSAFGALSVYRYYKNKNISLTGMILFVCTILVVMYTQCPRYKVYSIHGLFRGGISYQIINIGTPPLDPLFGGEILRYQWGYPWLAAQMSMLFNITPFSSFALINIVSLGGAFWLLYKISNLLIEDHNLNIFSAFFTLFCTSIIDANLIKHLGNIIPFFLRTHRPFPLFRKFLNVNGAPLGFLFFLLLLYFVMKLFEKKKIGLYSVLVFIGIFCTIFFFAAFGPVVLVWIGFLSITWFIIHRKTEIRETIAPVGLLLLALFLSLSLLYPYIQQVRSTGAVGKAELLNLNIAVQNLITFLVPTSLILLIILIYVRYIKKSCHRRNLLILTTLFFSALCCNLFFHLPGGRGEYKFLLLAQIPLGLIGAIAFTQIHKKNRLVALVLFLLLTYPPLDCYLSRYRFYLEFPIKGAISKQFAEKGINLDSKKPQENAMYQWIRANTPPNAYFIDSEMTIPTYGQRALWVGLDDKEAIGYNISMSQIKDIHGYDQSEYNRRQQVVKNIYGFENTLSAEEITEEIAKNRLYIIIRNDNTEVSLDHPDLKEAFCSESGDFRIIGPAVNQR